MLVVGGGAADSARLLATPTVKSVIEGTPNGDRDTSVAPEESIYLESRPISAAPPGMRRGSVGSVDDPLRPKVSIKYRERRQVVQLSSADFVNDGGAAE